MWAGRDEQEVAVQTGWIARLVLGTVARRLVDEARPRAGALTGRVRVAPEWRRVEDGRAARLAPTQTIEVTRKRRWRHREPLRVDPGWWPSSQALGLGTWAGVVGLAWWQGRRHGRGPLGALQETWDGRSPQE